MTGLLRGKLKVFLLIVTMFALMAAVACQGDQGQKGDPGAPGAPGNPGAPGSAGAAGEPGNPGEAGEPGAPGDPGNPGGSGSNGADGADGTDGVDGEDGDVLRVSGLMVFDANGSATGTAELTAGSASITVIGGGFTPGESVAVAYVTGNPILVGSAVANSNGAFTLTAELTRTGLFTITATGDMGNSGVSAFMIVDKIAE